MEAVHCNYCGQDNWQLVNEGPDLGLNRDGLFRLVRCRNCGLIYQNPRPTREGLNQFYPDEYALYQTSEMGSSRVAELSQQHAMSRRCQRVMRHVPTPGTVLDVGCATGQFLQAMAQQGWQTAGVELSEYAATQAREAGLTVFTGTLEEAAFPAQQFDLVTLWDVFEHVLDPKGTLAEIGRVLKPGGWVVIHTPNPTCPEARLFGGHWVGWERPRHLHLYTPAVLRLYLQDAGFELVSLESFSGRLSVTLLSVEYALKARGMPEEKWRPWVKLAYNLPLRLATWPLYRLLEMGNKVTGMTAFARLAKPGD